MRLAIRWHKQADPLASAVRYHRVSRAPWDGVGAFMSGMISVEGLDYRNESFVLARV